MKDRADMLIKKFKHATIFNKKEKSRYNRYSGKDPEKCFALSVSS